MNLINLHTIISAVDLFLIRSVLNDKFWKIKTLVFSCFITFCWLFVFNNGYIFENFRLFYADVLLHNPQPFFFWNGIVNQGQDPLTFQQFDTGSHEANRIFRLTMPLIARYMHLNPLGLYLLQVVLGGIFLYLLINILSRITENKLITFYLFFAFVNVYAGACFFLNCFGHGDGYTFFFLIGALVVRSPIFISIFCQLAFWCDERSVIVSLSIWVFHLLYYQLNRSNSVKVLVVVFFNVILYGVVRVYLSRTFHLVAEDVENFKIEKYLYFIKHTSLWYGKRTSVAVEGFSLIIFLAFIISFRLKDYKRIGLFILCFLPIIAITFLVDDTVRTLSFSFIFWLIALMSIKEHVSEAQFKVLILIVAFINILIPVTFP